MRLPLFALILASAPAPARAQDLPPAILAYGAEASAQCAAQGGSPRIGPAFATAMDLNGDGRLDHVIDLAGLECAGAWSAFCGPAGCPLSVWIEGPGGPERMWSETAQAWTIDGAGPRIALVVTRQGAACADAAESAAGEAGTCAERVTFASPDAPAPPAPDAAPAPGWSLRALPDGRPVAVSPGAGAVRTLAVFCLSGEPFLAAAWSRAPAPETAELGFGFASGALALPARREQGADDALVAGLRGQPLAGRLAGRDSAAELSVDGAAQGPLSLKGSTRAIRDALAACMPL